MSERTVSRLWLVNAVLATGALFLSMYVGYRYVGLIDCLADRDQAVARRTAAIAYATDAERRAEQALLRAPSEELRAQVLAAYLHTDRVRALHPAPRVERCD